MAIRFDGVNKTRDIPGAAGKLATLVGECFFMRPSQVTTTKDVPLALPANLRPFRMPGADLPLGRPKVRLGSTRAGAGSAKGSTQVERQQRAASILPRCRIPTLQPSPDLTV
jgi:hypothetical protein